MIMIDPASLESVTKQLRKGETENIGRQSVKRASANELGAVGAENSPILQLGQETQQIIAKARAADEDVNIATVTALKMDIKEGRYIVNSQKTAEAMIKGERNGTNVLGFFSHQPQQAAE